MKPAYILVLLLLTAHLASGCTDDFTTQLSDDHMELSASATPFIQATRAEVEQIAYRIYTISDPTKDWTDENNNLSETTEASGYLGYSATTGGTITGEDIPTHFLKKAWYFYGLTLSNGDNPADSQLGADAVEIREDATTTGKKTPFYHFNRRHATDEAGKATSIDTLPDVRAAVAEAAVKIDDTNNGIVPLAFKHTLAQLKVIISHAATSGNGYVEWDEVVPLNALSVKDHPGGTFDLANNQWIFEDDDADLNDYTMISEPVNFNSELVSATSDFLIFPTSSLSITVQIGDNKPVTSVLTHTVEVEEEVNGVTTTKETEVPLPIEANHSYTIIMQYYKDGTYVITTHPDYYDYVDYTETAEELSIGTPTLFNGVVWADRNIGATSATYNNIEEWEEMRGYYYQPGRNIPYKVYPVAGNIHTKTCDGTDGSTKGYQWVQSTGDVGNTTEALQKIGQYLYPYLPNLFDLIPKTWSYGCFSLRNGTTAFQFRQNGNTNPLTNTVTSYYDAEKNKLSGNDNKPENRVFITSNNYANGKKYLYLTLPQTIELPDDESARKEYLEQFQYIGNASTANNWIAAVSGLWADASTQTSPCPPGWRIPTDEEWKGIFPPSTKVGDITYQLKNHTDTTLYSWFESNPSDPRSGYTSQYYCYCKYGQQTTGETQHCGDLYIIKKVGQSSAYGLRITVDNTTLASNSNNDNPDTKGIQARTVVNIDRYTLSVPAKASMSINNYPKIEEETGLYYTLSGGDTIYWYPVEQLKLPVCGVAHYMYLALIWSGTEAQYATAEGHTVRIKVGGGIANRYLYLDTGTRTAGLSIRPVRDAESSW